MAVAAVTGLIAEARIARRIGLPAAAAGGHADRTRAMIDRFLAEGATGLISFGIAGGLDPALSSGALVLADAVRDERGGVRPVDPRWQARLVAALTRAGIAVHRGDMLGAGAIAVSIAGKAQARRTTGAVAVDLESHLVAGAAAAAGLPFVVLRAIADPAARGLPPAALVGLAPDGSPALLPVLASLLRHPGQLPALLQAARDSGRALAALRRAAGAAGPELRGATAASSG
jgi:adenosylhomocysteine nucleosidase